MVGKSMKCDSLDSLGCGVTCVTELHDDGQGRDYVYKVDGRDVCSVSTTMRQLDVYQSHGLSWLETLRLSRALIHAAERLSQIEFAARSQSDATRRDSLTDHTVFAPSAERHGYLEEPMQIGPAKDDLILKLFRLDGVIL